MTYAGLSRIDQILTDNRCPRQTTVITGSKNTDTRTLPASRVAYIGSELVPVVKAMKDMFQERAFIPAHKYADAGNVLNGEIGSVDNIGFVQVPKCCIGQVQVLRSQTIQAIAVLLWAVLTTMTLPYAGCGR